MNTPNKLTVARMILVPFLVLFMLTGDVYKRQVDNMNIEVNKGEIVSLIGPNGAGKTTAFNVITGVYAPTNGAVYFQGEKIIENHPQGKMKKLYQGENNGKYTHSIVPTPDKITKLGIARTFQNIRLFKSQTVFELSLIHI